jgi:D-methionine transport system ATP-binding protein
MEVIKAVCNHVAVIDKGKLLAKGTLSEIISNRENPVIQQFINSDVMTLPQELNNRLQKEPQDGLFPLVEIELNEKISVEQILSALYNEYKIPYKLLKADVEYFGNSNFGKLLLQLQGEAEENQQAIYYFNQNKIQNTVKGYA